MKILLNSFFIFIFFSSCSAIRTKQVPSTGPSVGEYFLKDLSGEFEVTREVGKKNGTSYVKTVFFDSTRKNILEKGLVISESGVVKSKNRNITLMRPRLALREVWIEGKKYETKMKLDLVNRKLNVLHGEADQEKKQMESISLSGRKNYCFFSQILECAEVKNYFLYNSKKSHQAIKMKVQIIWDGYPFFNQQYPTLNEEILSDAELSYDGEDPDGLARHRLDANGDTIVFHTNAENKFIKMTWVSQGLTQELTKMNKL